VALLAGSLLSLLLARIGPEWTVDTIGSRFTWTPPGASIPAGS